jgi:hypothetical protein
MTDLKLPPLPKRAGHICDDGYCVRDGDYPLPDSIYTEHQMREYARQAVYEWEAACADGVQVSSEAQPKEPT